MSFMGHNNATLEDAIGEVEKLMEERAEINDAIKDRLAKAEADGFDKKVIREMIKLRVMEREDRVEFEDKRSAYRDGLDLI